MAASKRNVANNKYKEEMMKKFMDYAKQLVGDDWVKQTKSGTFGFYFVNDEGDEETLTITLSVPNGSRDGDPYDLDAEAQEYEQTLKKNAEKVAKAEAEKQKKIEQDKKRREAMAKRKEEKV